MTRPSPDGSSASTPGAGKADEDSDLLAQIEKQTARVVARQKLVEAQVGALAALSPGVSDGPTNTVTLGAKAGSLAPWLAQSVLADLSRGIATATWGAIPSEDVEGEKAAADTRVVFVTDDPELLATDVVSRQVQSAMRGRTRELVTWVGSLAGAATDLAQAVDRYQRSEAGRDEDRVQGGGTRELVLNLLSEATGDALAATAGVAATQEAETTAAAEAAEGAEADEPATEPDGAGAAGPLGVALDLVELLAVDYTVTAAEVTVESALLARLTAGELGSSRPTTADQVLLDGFAPAADSSTLKAYDRLITALNRTVDATQDLERVLAPVAAEAEVYRVSVAEVQKAWEKAVAEPEDDPDADADFEDVLDELEKRLLARQRAASPAESLVEACATVTTAVRQELAALATPDSAGISPLQRACSATDSTTGRGTTPSRSRTSCSSRPPTPAQTSSRDAPFSARRDASATWAAPTVHGCWRTSMGRSPAAAGSTAPAT